MKNTNKLKLVVISSTLIGLTTIGVTFARIYNPDNSASNLTGTVGVANGGTGAATLSDGQLLVGNGTSAVQSVKDNTGFSYATSTTWTGTTTILFGPAPAAVTADSVRCETDAGTLFVSLYDGTNRADDLQASTTIGTITYTTNNTFTAGESMRLDVGTPASSPTKIACRFLLTY